MTRVTNIDVGWPFFLLTLLFVALKLTHHIDWPWIWVVSPMWLPFAAFMSFIVAFFTVACVTGMWALVIGLVAVLIGGVSR